MKKNKIDQSSQYSASKSNQPSVEIKKKNSEKKSAENDPVKNDPTRNDKPPLIISKL